MASAGSTTSLPVEVFVSSHAAEPLLMDDDGGMLGSASHLQGQRGYHGALNTEGGKRWIDVRTRTML